MASLRERRARAARLDAARTPVHAGAPVSLAPRLRALALASFAWALGSCSVGHGDGDVAGQLFVAHCRAGAYSLNPTAFFAQAVEEVLRISVQRGSDTEMHSDGLAVLVEDAARVKRELLDRDLPIGPDADPAIDLTLYLNESCPAERDKTPVVLSGVRGTIRFSALYAPRVNKDQVRISAEFTGVRFEDPRTPERWAELDGNFDFLYVRGRPAQRFP